MFARLRHRRLFKVLVWALVLPVVIITTLWAVVALWIDISLNRWVAIIASVGFTVGMTAVMRFVRPRSRAVFIHITYGPVFVDSATERLLFLRQDQEAASDGQVAKKLVNLYRALGGGWDETEANYPAFLTNSKIFGLGSD